MRSNHLRTTDSVILSLLIAIGMAPLIPVYGGTTAIPAIAGGLLIGWTAGTVPGWRRYPLAMTFSIAFVGYFLFGGVLAARDTTAAGFPTFETLQSLATGAVLSWKRVLTLQTPLGGMSNYLIVPFLLALLGAAVSASIVWRVQRPKLAVLAILTPLVALGIAMALATKESVFPIAIGLSLTAGSLVWMSWRLGQLHAKRIVIHLITIVVVALAAVGGGPALVAGEQRYVLRDEIDPPFDIRDYPSPLAGFRHYVKAWKDKNLLTVTGLPKGASIRLATMDRFDGVVWNLAGDSGSTGSGEFRRVGSAIPTSVQGKKTHVKITVHDLDGVWLPTVGQATQFTFDPANRAALAADLRFNDATGTAMLPKQLVSGMAYSFDSIWAPNPGAKTIGSSSAGSVELPPAQRVPDIVDTEATAVSGAASSPALVAEALARELSEKGFFSHGIVDAGDYPSLSGHGAARIDTLLDTDMMVGDDEQYTSAMALMARAMGLPSRVVLGFTPSEDNSSKKSITLTGADISAWVEINFEGHGWVPFFPTPPKTQTPQDQQQEVQQNSRPQVIQPPLDDHEEPKAPDENPDQAKSTNDDPLPDTATRTIILVIVAAISIPLAVIGTPILVILATKRRLRKRRATSGGAIDQIAGGWREVLDRFLDMNRRPGPATTRLEIAAAISSTFSKIELTPAIVLLAHQADAAVFNSGYPSEDSSTAYWQSVDSVISTIKGELTLRQRFAASISLASLRANRSERSRRGRRRKKGVKDS